MSSSSVAIKQELGNAKASPKIILLEDIIYDLVLWPQVLTDNQRIFLTERGPVQIKLSSYPINSSKRTFPNNYYKRLPMRKPFQETGLFTPDPVIHYIVITANCSRLITLF